MTEYEAFKELCMNCNRHELENCRNEEPCLLFKCHCNHERMKNKWLGTGSTLQIVSKPK